MTGKIIDLIKDGNITFPKLLLNNYKKLKITEKELILIIYLINNNEFDPERISKDLDIKVADTLKLIDSLSKKDILKIVITKDTVCEEYINLDELYNKLALLLINKQNESVSNIYDKFQSEFARPLSTLEYQLIGSWLDNNFSEELIEEALKEAIYNNAPNLKYIDRILLNWQSKGIKTKEDVKKEKSQFKSKKPKKEVFEYDWLNEKD